jgi:DNA-directed RNA polymerase beta' subunit
MESKFVPFRDPVKFEVNMNELIELGLSVEEFFILNILRMPLWKLQLRKYEKFVKEVDESVIVSLILKGYVKKRYDKLNTKNLNNLILTNKYHKILNREKANVESWINEWRNLWPKGVRSGGYYIRGNRENVLYKMKLFLEFYPYCTKDLIFKATKNYIEKMAIDGYKYSKLAHYFIMKDDTSILADECESVIDDEEFEKEVEKKGAGYGEREL